MSPQTAQQTVLAVVLVGGAVVIWDNIKKTGKASPGGKQLVSFAILAAGLAILAGVSPTVGGYLALLIGLAIVVSRVGGKSLPFGSNLFGK